MKFLKTSIRHRIHDYNRSLTDSHRFRASPFTMSDKLTRIAIVNSDKCKPKKCRQGIQASTRYQRPEH